MSQREWMQEFDAAAGVSFKASGIADDAILTRKISGATVACTVLVDMVTERQGDQGQVVAVIPLITCQRADVGAQPTRGDSFAILDDDSAVSDTYTVDALEGSDESVFVLRCKVGG